MSFQVRQVRSWDQLWQVFDQCPGAYPLAGGTDILPRVNQGIERHPLFVCLEGLEELRGVTVRADGSVWIGALTRLAEIGEEEALSGFAALREACAHAASPQIRSQGTIGGNVLQENRCVFFNQSVSWRREAPCFKLGGDRCYQYARSPECVALFQSDAAPALLACGARAVWRSPRGQRTAPLEELYLPGGRRAKAADEILTALVLPPAEGRLCSAYVRQTIRAAFDFPLISCAAALQVRAGRISRAGVALGSAGARPELAEEAGRLLVGRTPEEAAALAAEVRELAARRIAPFRDSRVDGPTRKALGRDAIQRALLGACGRCASHEKSEAEQKEAPYEKL